MRAVVGRMTCYGQREWRWREGGDRTFFWEGGGDSQYRAQRRQAREPEAGWRAGTQAGVQLGRQVVDKYKNRAPQARHDER